MTDPQLHRNIPVVGIGASAGGLEALRELFHANALVSTGMAFVVIQHLDPTHESLMAQLLERYTSMTVTQIAGGERIEPDHIYVIPPAHGVAIHDDVLELTEFREARGLRRPIDDFFECLAEDQGENAACVILSGTGGDGSRGLKSIKGNGGLAVAQEPTSARYDGMPLAAVGTGLVDVVARPHEVIEVLRSFFDRAHSVELQEEADDAADHIDDMCSALRDAVGHDFSGYKRSTLSRRIARRMQVVGLTTSAAYLARLRADPGECQALFRDLLINVTRFFRDLPEWEALTTRVIEPLVQEVRDGGEIRIWVAGCSSGEEAYTVAVLVHDAMERLGKRAYLQVFGTDIDDRMLDIARHGAYPLAALEDLPDHLRDRYTVAGADAFTFAPSIRDAVRFSSHNLLRDPPFAKIDLICCRNLLIYFDEGLQRQVIPTFHFSLAEGGHLFLGASESIGRFDDLFAPVEQKARIFQRKPAISRYTFQPAPHRRSLSTPVRQPHPDTIGPASIELRALRRIADTYGPVTLVVDSEGTLLRHWGATSRYLDFPARMDQRIEVSGQAKAGLRETLGPLLRETVRQSRRQIARDVAVRTDFGTQRLTVVAEPLEAGAFLIVLRPDGEALLEPADPLEVFEVGESEVQFLRDELQHVRERLRSTTEELETTNEELKSSNEEMMSMNEELQSTNEELITVNDELKTKVDELMSANADLKNFFASTDLCLLVVDGGLHLRSYTGAAARLFKIGPQMVGCHLDAIEHSLDSNEFVEMAGRAVAGHSIAGVPIAGGERRYMLHVLPYRRLDGSVDGATLVFADITEAASLEQDLAEGRTRLRMALDVAQIGVWEYEPATGRVHLDETEKRLLDIPPGAPASDLEPILARLPVQDRDRVNNGLRRAMDGDQDFDEVFRLVLSDGETRWLHGLGRRASIGDRRKFIGVTYDITAEREQLAARELMIMEMNHRVKNLFAVISSLITLSGRQAEAIEPFVETLQSRISALGRSHALTVDNASGEAGLRAVLDTIVRPSANGQRVDLQGDAIDLPNRMVTPLALIIHEWTTNAVKYGALGVPGGHLSVQWQRHDGQVLIEWTETGLVSPKPVVVGTNGFGTKLIQITARQLGGAVTAANRDDGYQRTLKFPL